jgi:ribosomal protein L7/L12
LISERLAIDCPPFAGDVATPEASETVVAEGAGGRAEPSPSGLPAEVVELARAGHSTQAISLLRRLTGASLVEAKRAVDAL